MFSRRKNCSFYCSAFSFPLHVFSSYFQEQRLGCQFSACWLFTDDLVSTESSLKISSQESERVAVPHIPLPGCSVMPSCGVVDILL